MSLKEGYQAITLESGSRDLGIWDKNSDLMWDSGGGNPPVCVRRGRGGVPWDPGTHPLLLRAVGSGRQFPETIGMAV